MATESDADIGRLRDEADRITDRGRRAGPHRRPGAGRDEGQARSLDDAASSANQTAASLKETAGQAAAVAGVDATPGHAVTLVGCYPFYHVGSAPQRFIVRAVPVAEPAPAK